MQDETVINILPTATVESFARVVTSDSIEILVCVDGRELYRFERLRNRWSGSSTLSLVLLSSSKHAIDAIASCPTYYDY